MGSMLLVMAIVAAASAAGAAAWSRKIPTKLLVAASAACLSVAAARLAWAILKLDFSFVYVANQSRAQSGGGYRFAALWSGAEGSLLMFCTLLALVLALGVWRGGLQGWGIGVPAAALGLMTTTVMVFANPFDRAALPPVRGAGLTPILEHPAMLYHPPILYLGLVTTLMPFALALGTDNPLHDPVLSSIRRWVLIAWTLLTVGLATGANWAYVELGWGGYWAWDPVENTVLMPWLILTAAVHITRSPQLCHEFPRTSLALVLTPFVFVAFGSAVTRSGGLSSVHAFAEADALGWMLGLVVLGLVAVIGWRVTTTARGPGAVARQRGRDVGLELAAGSAVFMTIVVLMGVALPLVPGTNRVVTADFYNRVGTPVLVLTLLVMALVPLLIGRRSLVARLLIPGACLAGVAISLIAGISDWLSLASVGLGAAVVVGHLVYGRSIRVATVIGHIGFVVVAFGIAGSAQSSVTTAVLAPGESQSFGSELMLRYESFVVTDGPRPRSEAITVTATVTDAGRNAIILTPGLVSYPDRAVVLAESALHSTPRRDVQVVVRTITDDGLASFELAERPAQMLVWWGSVLIAIAGLVAGGQSLSASRLRASSASSVDVGLAPSVAPPSLASEPVSTEGSG